MKTVMEWKPTNKLCRCSFLAVLWRVQYMMHILQTFHRIDTNLILHYSRSWVPDTQQGPGQEFGCHRLAMNLMGWVQVDNFINWSLNTKWTKYFLYKCSVFSSFTTASKYYQECNHYHYAVLTVVIYFSQINKHQATPCGLFWIVHHTL
jgi:hypothetical protein